MGWLLPPLPPKFEAALRDVHAKGTAARAAAAERLGRSSDEERARALPGLSILAGDGDPGVRATAIAGLGMLESSDHLDQVVAAFSDPFPEVRELAVLAAAQIGGELATTAVRDALESPAPEVRFQAVSALAELAPKDAPDALVPLLKDPDDEVRMQVVEAISGLAVPHLAGHVAGALDDPSPHVRLEAALALARLGDKRGQPALLEALGRRIRPMEVAEALANLRSEPAIEPLAQLARRWWLPPHLRAAAGAALFRLGDARGERVLRSVLSGFRSDARGYAVDLVRQIHARPLCGELAKLATRPRGVDLVILVEALAVFAAEDSKAHAALCLLREQPGEVGEAATAALRARVATGDPSSDSPGADVPGA